MKKSILGMLVLTAFGFFLFAMPAGAISLPYNPSNTEDSILGEPATDFGNSNEKTEYEWLQIVLSDYGVSLPAYGEGGSGLTKFEEPIPYPPAEEGKLIVFDPGFSWQFAVVKYNRTLVAYYDSNDDDLLSITVPKEISHVSFVPEPATMLLLGFGLIGLAAFGRKRFFKGT